jgi:hypothetical protein
MQTNNQKREENNEENTCLCPSAPYRAFTGFLRASNRIARWQRITALFAAVRGIRWLSIASQPS